MASLETYSTASGKLAQLRTAIRNSAIMARAQPKRAAVESRNPAVAPTPDRRDSVSVFLAPNFSAATAPRNVPSNKAGSEKNMPTKAPPLAPVIPHLEPPKSRVPIMTPAMSAMTERNQKRVIQPITHQPMF